MKIEVSSFTTHSTRTLASTINLNTHQELQSSIVTTGCCCAGHLTLLAYSLPQAQQSTVILAFPSHRTAAIDKSIAISRTTDDQLSVQNSKQRWLAHAPQEKSEVYKSGTRMWSQNHAAKPSTTSGPPNAITRPVPLQVKDSDELQKSINWQ